MQEIINFIVASKEFSFKWGRVVLDYLHTFFKSTFEIIIILALIMTLVYVSVGVYLFFMKKKKDNYHFNPENAPHVTIQIPTYNELAALNCARKCLNFDYPKNKFDIIIGDDSDDKFISKKINDFAKQHKQITVTRRGKNIGFKPGNLNHMLKFTKGDLITIFDSDFLPEKDFLRKMVAPFQKDPKLAGTQARWEISNKNQNLVTILGTGIVDTCHKVILPFVEQFGKTVVFCGSAEVVRKDLLIKLGGWTSGALTEDIDYSFRAIGNGNSVKFLKNVSCFCEVPQTWKDLAKQQKRWGYGVIRALVENWKKVFSKKIETKRKLMIGLFSSGYLFTTIIFLLIITGTLAIITHRPEPINWGLFLSETAKNFALTSGLVIITVFAALISKTSKVNILKLLAGTFSFGILVVFYVVDGIYRAIVGLPMQWYMLKKNGNEIKD